MFEERTNLQNSLEYIGLKILIFIVFLLRRKVALFFGKILAFVVFYFIPFRKGLVLTNISLSFPEKSKKEVNKIAKSTYKTFVKVFIDMFFI
ncbi:MAG: hypothetical protein LBB44_03785, partial [Endomicrobium sp.]|nr:hypothetical protein [Endomicrobium sp.]